MLDHGSHIFIWLGTASATAGGTAGGAHANGWTQDVVEAAAQGFVAGLADGRFPVPEVRVAVEVPQLVASVRVGSRVVFESGAGLGLGSQRNLIGLQLQCPPAAVSRAAPVTQSPALR